MKREASYLHVNVPCQYLFSDDRERCGHDIDVHLHEPIPCANGQSGRHHEYTPPASVRLMIAGKVRTVRLR